MADQTKISGWESVPASPSLRPSWEIAAATRTPTAVHTPTLPRSSASSLSEASGMPSTEKLVSEELISEELVSEELVSEDEITYDLAGNPVAARPRATPAPAPFSYAAAPTPGVWPPAPGNSTGAQKAFRNNSGEQSHLPPEIASLKWNWGAFFFPTMWCRKHGLTSAANFLRYGFLAIVVLRMVFRTLNPYVFLGLGIIYALAFFATRIYFALKGHEMGWRNRHFPGGLEEYFKVQKAWMLWGIGVTVFFQILLPVIAFAVFFGVALHAARHTGARYGSGSSYGGPHRFGSAP